MDGIHFEGMFHESCRVIVLIHTVEKKSSVGNREFHNFGSLDGLLFTSSAPMLSSPT